MAITDNLGITELENLQIEALKLGATSEEISILIGNKANVTMVPPIEAPVAKSGRAGVPISDLPQPPKKVSPGIILEDFPIERLLDGKVEDLIGPDGSVQEEEEDLSMEEFDPIQEENELTASSEALSLFPVTSYSIDIDNKTLDLLVLKSAIEPERDISELYDEGKEELINSSNKLGLLESYRKKYAIQQKQTMLNITVDDATAGKMDIKDASDILEASEDFAETYSGIKGQERIFVEKLAPLNMDEFLMANHAAKNHSWARYNEFYKSLGKGEIALNWVGEFFVPDTWKDASDLMDGGFIKGKSDLLKLVAKYGQTDPRFKPELFDEIFDKAIIAYDRNHLKLAFFVQLFHSFEPETEFNIRAAFDAIEILTSATLATSVNVIKATVNGVNIVRKAKKLRAIDEAVALDNAPREGADVVTRSMNNSPFDMEDHLPFIGSTDGISKEHLRVQEEIVRGIKEDIVAPVKKTLDEANRNKVFGIEDVERERVAATSLEAIRKKAKDEEVIFESIKPISIDDNGFTLEYRLDGVDQVETRSWQFDDAGTFMEINKDFKTNGVLKTALTFALDPTNLLRNITESIVDNITFGSLQSARVRNELVKTLKATNKSLTKSERLAVDELIAAGDEAKEVYKISDLLDGSVQLRSGQRPYTIPEITAYSRRLAFNRQMWEIQNMTIKGELDFRGAKTINLNLSDDSLTTQMIGVPDESYKSFPSEMPNNERILMPQSRGSDIVTRGDLDLDALKLDGFIPVKLIQPHKAKDGKAVNWVFIKEEGPDGKAFITNLPDDVLTWNPWYTPRIYRPGLTYVKVIDTGDTVRAFERHRDAIAFKDELMAKDPSVKLDVVADRDFTQLEALMQDANFYGGPFSGARKSENLVLNAAGDRIPRLSYNDAMNRYIDNISEIMPLNEYRLALKERWINSVNVLAKAEGKPFGINPDKDWKDAKVLITDKKLRVQMEFARDYMRNQFRLWSSKERSWNRLMTTIAEMSEGKGVGKISNIRDKVSQGALNLASKEPIPALRAATFHTKLGWFNIRQLYIQSQNASIAIVQHPIHGLPASKDMMGMKALLYMSDETLDKVKLNNTLGLGNLVNDVKDFRVSGLEDSILKNADINAQREGLTNGTFAGLKKLANAGLLFYKNGELISRLISWGIAKRQLGLKGDRLTPKQLKDVVKEVNRLNMNMQSTNAAKFQLHPVTANATQFLQVQTKWVTNILTGIAGHGQWTKKEAWSAAGGQLLMYGVIGVPLAEEATEFLMEELGIGPEELQAKYPNLAEFVGDGAIGMLMGALGFQNQFGGDTASLWAAMDDNILVGFVNSAAVLFTGAHGEDSIGEIAFGPSANTVRRVYDATVNVVDSLKSLYMEPTLKNAAGSTLLAFEDYASVFSSYNYARQVREMHRLNQMFSRSGEVIVGKKRLEQMNLLTKLAMIAGIPSDILTAYYSLSKANRKISLDKAGRKKDMIRAQIQALKDGNIDRYRGLLLWHAGNLGTINYSEIVQDITNKAIKGQVESKLEKEYQKHMTNMLRSGGFKSQIEITNIVQPQLEQQQQEREIDNGKRIPTTTK